MSGPATAAALGVSWPKKASQVWRAPPIDLSPAAAAPAVSSFGLFRQGALAAVTNPKGVLFFAAFLPQFIDPARSLPVQFAVMAGTFAVVEMLTEWVLASTAQRLRPWLRRVGRRFNRACGGALVALGAALPLRG
jgi:threonine/homoserine/homoserine lactone efflux protein